MNWQTFVRWGNIIRAAVLLWIARGGELSTARPKERAWVEEDEHGMIQMCVSRGEFVVRRRLPRHLLKDIPNLEEHMRSELPSMLSKLNGAT